MRAHAKRQEGGSSSRPQQQQCLSPAMRECSLAFMGAPLMCSKSSATRDAGARAKRQEGDSYSRPQQQRLRFLIHFLTL
ncbi:hypothetical protein NDU88_006354 [Pleurodeles waltl]|uniref:Uncharacterized protein n=1 Tax=Pleurodeles waltl TaxID=8319 RepID=A0AAV7WEH2_PLEWA|nr:hypothetical protein NDU88_006354 [Pleurodeles waltl]